MSTLVIPEGAKCPCGQDLPWHLFQLDLGNFQSHCSCDRVFAKVDGNVQQIGVEKNKIAEWDRNHEWNPDVICQMTGTKGAWVPKAG